MSFDRDLSNEQRRSDIQAVLSTGPGRRFVYDLLHVRCLLQGATGSGGVKLEGRREMAVGLNEWILFEFPELHRQMVIEGATARAEEVMRKKTAPKESRT